VTLYERGAWLCGRQHDRVWRGTVLQLREMLGVPEGAYRNWTELRRNTLDLAVPEVDQLGHFTTTVSDTRRGRQVVGVPLAFEPKRPPAMEAAQRNWPRRGKAARPGARTRCSPTCWTRKHGWPSRRSRKVAIRQAQRS